MRVPGAAALRAPHIVGPGLAIVIVIGIGLYSYSEGRAYKAAAEHAAQARDAVAWAQGLLSMLKDAETGQRGYLLTGDRRYLAPYSAALPRIAGERARMGRLAFANPEDARRLSDLIGTKLDELAQTIQVRESGGAQAALEIVQTDRGKETMDRIRDLGAQLVTEENTQLASREATVARHGYETRILVLGGAIVLALLLWATSARVNHLLRAQQGLISDLAASREQEARGRAALATTLRSIGDAVITTDAASRVQFMNPVAEALTGWSNAAAEGRSLPEVFHIVNESTRQEVENPATMVLRQGVIVGLANHTVLLARDGRQIPIDDSGAPILGESGTIAGVVLVFRDVTQRRKAQRTLEESERRYRLLFEGNPWPMWVYDREDLAFLAVNEAAVKSYGYTREEFLHMTLRDIRPPEDVAKLLVDTASPSVQLHTDGPWRHRKKDGSIVFVEITSHPIQFGKNDACLVLANDITERMRLEEQLRQSQKLEAVGQLAGGIAHDFNNLLTVIEGYAELVYGDLPEADPNRPPIQEILVAAQRAASLTRQLLAFSRRQMLQPIHLSLNANLASVQRMLGRLLGENIAIATDLAADLWDVFADPGQIDQIILNLAVNARDAMEQGGTLTVRTANMEVKEEQAAAAGITPGKYARVSISDTGHGMDAETQRHIFEPFFTTKEVGRGTGLGLSTVYGIVKQSGGHILVESEPGKGSTFSILMPAAREPLRPAASGSAASAAGRAGGETILVVEDDDVVRNLVVSMLRSTGYKVISPITPKEALELCADTEKHIDLLLTDMVLPETDGGAIAEAARRLRPGLRVMFMSGYTEHPVLRRNPMDGSALFLQKPFTKAGLLSKVREALA
jgi:two-component system, cell cycle sensor histidine kinase and response regulator CckA